jgi:hypothetical protein
MTKQEKEEEFRKFWEELSEDPEIQKHFQVSVTGHQSCYFRWGQIDAPFGVEFYQRGRRLFTNLCLRCTKPPGKQNKEERRTRTKRLYDALAQYKSEIDEEYNNQIDKELGEEPLEWQRRDQEQESWVGASRQNVSIEDGPTLEGARKWAINRLLTLKKVLEGRLKRLGVAPSPQPRDEWERGLLEAARDCGVSLPDSALSSEGRYD